MGRGLDPWCKSVASCSVLNHALCKDCTFLPCLTLSPQRHASAFGIYLRGNFLLRDAMDHEIAQARQAKGKRTEERNGGKLKWHI